MKMPPPTKPDISALCAPRISPLTISPVIVWLIMIKYLVWCQQSTLDCTSILTCNSANGRRSHGIGPSHSAGGSLRRVGTDEPKIRHVHTAVLTKQRRRAEHHIHFTADTCRRSQSFPRCSPLSVLVLPSCPCVHYLHAVTEGFLYLHAVNASISVHVLCMSCIWPCSERISWIIFLILIFSFLQCSAWWSRISAFPHFNLIVYSFVTSVERQQKKTGAFTPMFINVH